MVEISTKKVDSRLGVFMPKSNKPMFCRRCTLEIIPKRFIGFVKYRHCRCPRHANMSFKDKEVVLK